MKPIIIANNSLTDSELESYKNKHAIHTIVDIYDQQIEELQQIYYSDIPGEAWVHYPWQHTLLHCIGSDALFALRTNRNKLLINEKEQRILRKAVVGVAGMSVGSGIALGSVYSGISDTIKIADRDLLDTSNLNRLREPLLAVGEPKVALAARHIYELNPFADVHVFDEGLSDESIDAFLDKPKLSVVIDEIDDFRMKIQLRVKAREYGIPLLMFTSLGDSILVDVERYDINPKLELFNGVIPGISEEILSKEDITGDDAKRYAVQLVGASYVPTRALGSLLEIGRSLAGRPQLYSTIAVDGGLAAYVIRCLLLNQPLASGRYSIRFAELFGMRASEFEDSPERGNTLKALLGR